MANLVCRSRAIALISLVLLGSTSWAGPVKVSAPADAVALPDMGTAGLSRTAGATLLAPALGAPGLSSQLSLLAPAALPAPAVKAAVAASAAAAPQAQRPSVAQLSQAVSAEVANIQKPDLAAEASASSGQRIEDIITGHRSGGSGEVSVEALAAPADAGSAAGLAPAGAVSASQKTAQPAAPAQAQVKTTDSRIGYGFKRRILAAVASVFGVTASLPPAGPAVTAAALEQAAQKRVVFSDFDDTLAPWSTALSAEMAAALVAVRQAGKEVLIVTDRADVSKGRDVGAFETLATIPAAERVGMYVAADTGGKVYRYNAQGEPVKVWQYPVFDEARRAPVQVAVDALKSRLAELGTSLYPGSAHIPVDNWRDYSYSMMLAVGTPMPVINKVAAAFEAELKSQGLEVTVYGRIPKDPSNPPYLTFSVIDKSTPVKYLSQILNVQPWEALAMGDNMFSARKPDAPSRLYRWAQSLAERVSGRPIPQSQNETDRNMEKALPGMLAFSVGGTADPRMGNAFVMPAKGPAASLQILRAMASRPAATQDPKRYWKMAGAALVLALVIGVIFLGWYTFYHAFFEAASKIPSGPDIEDFLR